MANHKSTKKSIKKNIKRTAINKMRVSEIRTFVKKVDKAVAENNKEQAQAIFKETQSKIAKGVTKGVLKFNTASRKIQRLAAKIKKIA
jgi:small subunit ribosomal protein S20